MIDSHRCNDCNAPDGDYLNGDIICLNVRIDCMKSRVELPRAKAKACADSKEGCYHRQDVNKVTDPSKDPVADEWVETRLHCHWQILTEADKTKEESN